MSMFPLRMYIRPYIGVESGIQAVPELSRLIGSAKSMEDGIAMPDSSHVGRTYVAPGQVVDGQRARAFAAALGGDDPVAEPEAVPPTFAAVFMLFPTLGQLFGDAEVGIDLAGLIHGEQHFTWHAAVHAGDVIDASARIASVQEKRGMTFVGVDLEAARQGQVVCSGSSVLIVRGASS